MATITVQVAQDNLFEGSDTSALATIDTAATVQRYLDELATEIRRSYPEATVEVTAGALGEDRITVDSGTNWRDEQEIETDVRELGGEVFERGTFWVEQGEEA
ncbi:MAG TPA: hypothetical protein VF041_23315 [Gemmatimonadaceae bacterium]